MASSASPANPYSHYWLALQISMPGHSPVFSTSVQLYAIFFKLFIGAQVAEDLLLHNLNLFLVKGLTQCLSLLEAYEDNLFF